MIKILDEVRIYTSFDCIYGDKWWPKHDLEGLSESKEYEELFKSAQEYGVIVVNTNNDKKPNGDEYAVYQFEYRVQPQENIENQANKKFFYRVAEMPVSEFKDIFVKSISPIS